MQKECSRCHIMKPLEMYAIRNDTKHGYRRGVCRICLNLRTKEHWRKYRELVFNHYGWTCKCCGETMRQFMSIDHINSDGYLDKNPNGSKKSGKELYLLIVKQGFPNKYQTLCMNCNWGKKIGNGKCPHESN